MRQRKSVGEVTGCRKALLQRLKEGSGGSGSPMAHGGRELRKVRSVQGCGRKRITPRDELSLDGGHLPPW